MHMDVGLRSTSAWDTGPNDIVHGVVSLLKKTHGNGIGVFRVDAQHLLLQVQPR